MYDQKNELNTGFVAQPNPTSFNATPQANTVAIKATDLAVMKMIGTLQSQISLLTENRNERGGRNGNRTNYTDKTDQELPETNIRTGQPYNRYCWTHV